ncbi:MAG: ATP-binding protein, partial [Anaerolineae bacterium]
RRAILERRPFDLLPLLKEEVKLLERTLPENITITLDYDSDPRASYVLNGSPTAMQQILMNLAVNARDAMPNGGMLCFDLAPLHVEDTDADVAVDANSIHGIGAGEWIKLTVSDTGAGIPADVLPHIFDPFYTTKEPGAGTGLGLAQVYGIVGMHDGQIRVEAQEGAGATFIIYLPAVMVTAPEKPDTGVEELPPGQGQTILVVEDSSITRQAVADSLVALDYRVQVAENGQQALTILEERPEEIALVLSDVVMPGMGGIGLIEAMQQRGLNTPVVLLTGHPLKKDWANLKVDWILKPPNLETLARVIAKALEG